MKKFIVFAMVATVLTIFNGCQKDELGVRPQADDVKLQDAVQPDVYVEDDYLVFKDFETYDSLALFLNESPQTVIEEFEASLQFKSAYSYRLEMMRKLNELSDEGSQQLMTELESKGYYDSDDKNVLFPFKNESRACVLNPEGKVKIGKVIYEFSTNHQKMTISDGDKGIKNISKTIDIEKKIPDLKSSTVLWEYLASDGGQQRLKLKLLREDEAIYDYIIYNGQVVWGIIGYHWTVSVRFHSYRQRLLSSPDRETYFHWIVYRLNIGGNNGFYHHQYYPSNPFTDTSDWKAIHYEKLYDSGLSPNIDPPNVGEVKMDCWSDRVPNKTYLNYP